MLLNEIVRLLTTIQTAKDRHQYAPARGAAEVPKDDAEEDETLILRLLLHLIGHTARIRRQARQRYTGGRRQAADYGLDMQKESRRKGEADKRPAATSTIWKRQLPRLLAPNSA
ncbi:hypothetical protein [Methylobacterium sp. UNC378MF]|uniref:hypothetical protein n=1 Tax=Methylobacterium sp. UNC378MF TaxID=1502748 RepID=UPI0015870FC3|nr:hypothetical protein [Methylobacterium sp. UNC378MF]